MVKDGHLISWIGQHDLNGIAGLNTGPLQRCIVDVRPNRVTLLCNYEQVQGEAYLEWLGSFTGAELNLIQVDLKDPTDYEKIYLLVRDILEDIVNKIDEPLLYNVTSGTPAMTSIWILLAKTVYAGSLYHTQQQTGTNKINFPFELTANYLPDVKTTSVGLNDLLIGLDSESVAFNEIIHEDIQMKKVIARARRLAQHDVPVLIQGETGTGKELFAKAIHEESSRSKKKFFAINCGALPLELVESQFFGYKKGAFTGAVVDKPGIFEKTTGGTVFLDEIGELPLVSQVKLLRALQEGEVTRVGDTSPIKIDVRIIAATHQNLVEQSARGAFRSDLFYRLAVGTILLPPLRERKNDLVLIAKDVIRKINLNNQANKSWVPKKLSANAIEVIKKHSWPGNVRELVNTLQRASIWTVGEEIMAENIEDSLLQIAEVSNAEHGELTEGFVLKDKLAAIQKYYVEKALEKTNGNLKESAKLLGEKNYQNISNWKSKYLK